MKAEVALDVVEAAYLPIEDDRAWIVEVLSRLERLGLGRWGGYTMRDSRPEPSQVVPLAEAGFPLEVVLGVFERVSSELHAFACRPEPRVDYGAARIARLAQAAHLTVAELVEQTGIPSLGLTALLGCGVRGTDGLVALLETRGRLSPHTVELLDGLGVHLEHASRLRARMRHREPRHSAAIFEPSGKALHLEPEARAVQGPLMGAVRASERARGAMRRLAPDEALSAWRGLVDGRWSVVEHVERDGKRMLLAFENTPQTLQFALAEPERAVLGYAALGHSGKAIAYELGFTEPQVSRLLHAGLRKLGLRSRAELIRLWGTIAPGDEEAESAERPVSGHHEELPRSVGKSRRERR